MIGEGSFGKVYRVKKQEFDKTYYSAVKHITIPQTNQDLRQMRAEGLNDRSAREYLQALVTDIIREIDLMSEFRGNSNIVSLEDHQVIERKDELVWDIIIRMELLTSLPDYVNEHPLQSDDVIKLGIHICRALELCALNSTIHRDIKPDNIFISRYGDFKLGDFGIARQIERTTSGLSKKGTYAFMAPEIFRGDEYGANVDIYSLGLVMYRLLNSGRLPFLPQYPKTITPKDRDASLMRRIKGESIPPIADLDVPLNTVILKACAFDRRSRFASAKEMRVALERLSNRPLPEPEDYKTDLLPQQRKAAAQTPQPEQDLQQLNTLHRGNPYVRQPIKPKAVQQERQPGYYSPAAQQAVPPGNYYPAVSPLARPPVNYYPAAIRQDEAPVSSYSPVAQLTPKVLPARIRAITIVVAVLMSIVSIGRIIECFYDFRLFLIFCLLLELTAALFLVLEAVNKDRHYEREFTVTPLLMISVEFLLFIISTVVFIISNSGSLSDNSGMLITIIVIITARVTELTQCIVSMRQVFSAQYINRISIGITVVGMLI